MVARSDAPWVLLCETLRCGTGASLAMMPFGLAFRMADLRVGHYGPKVAALLVDDPGPLFLFVQHLFIGWLSALPLVAVLVLTRIRVSPTGLGAVYGLLYYLVINALALPLYFGDPLPAQLGVAYVVPSLVVHLVFGAVVGFAGRRLSSVARGESPLSG